MSFPAFVLYPFMGLFLEVPPRILVAAVPFLVVIIWFFLGSIVGAIVGILKNKKEPA